MIELDGFRPDQTVYEMIARCLQAQGVPIPTGKDWIVQSLNISLDDMLTVVLSARMSVDEWVAYESQIVNADVKDRNLEFTIEAIVYPMGEGRRVTVTEYKRLRFKVPYIPPVKEG